MTISKISKKMVNNGSKYINLLSSGGSKSYKDLSDNDLDIIIKYLELIKKEEGWFGQNLYKR